jgi:hypothetical protein
MLAVDSSRNGGRTHAHLPFCNSRRQRGVRCDIACIWLRVPFCYQPSARDLDCWNRVYGAFYKERSFQSASGFIRDAALAIPASARIFE